MKKQGEYVTSRSDQDWEDPFKWINTYRFLDIDQDKKLENYSDQEIIFELEIKNHNKIK